MGSYSWVYKSTFIILEASITSAIACAVGVTRQKWRPITIGSLLRNGAAFVETSPTGTVSQKHKLLGSLGLGFRVIGL